MAEKATASAEKFTGYLFNPDSKSGSAKGIAFTKRLGYDIGSWEELRDEAIRRATLFPATPKGDKGFGQTYEQRLILFGKTGKPTNVIEFWIIEDGTPRLTVFTSKR